MQPKATSLPATALRIRNLRAHTLCFQPSPPLVPLFPPLLRTLPPVLALQALISQPGYGEEVPLMLPSLGVSVKRLPDRMLHAIGTVDSAPLALVLEKTSLGHVAELVDAFPLSQDAEVCSGELGVVFLAVLPQCGEVVGVLYG